MSDVSLPNTIAPPTVSTSEVQGNDEALRDFVNGSGWVDTTKYEDASVTDAKLASPNNSVYKTLLIARSVAAADVAAGTYALGEEGGALSDSTPISLVPAAPFATVYLDDADFTVASKTTKLRVRGIVRTNGTVPAITFTFGLYPVTWSGGADALVATLGTVVASSTAAIASPSANSATTAVSSDVNVPSDGDYCLGVVTSATLTNNSACLLSAQLQTRNV